MESKNLAMVAALQEEEEIELELGLSLGGSYRRQNGIKLESDTHFDAVSKEKDLSCDRSSVSPSFMVDSGQENGQKTKREIHALRRQEAKKKREEKQLKRSLCKGNFNNIHNNNNGMILKVKDFQAKEREVDTEERECKKIKKEDNGSDNRKINVNVTVDQNDGVNNNTGTCYPTACTSSPIIPLPYQQPPVRYGMPANGFVYPCANVNVVPCWFTGGRTGSTEERNVVQVQPVVGYGFVPFRAALNPGHNLGNGYASEQNCSSGDRGNRNAGSKETSKCTTSTGSDHRSSSREGGSSNSSSSSPSLREQPQSNGSFANAANAMSDHTAISHLTETASANEATNSLKKAKDESKSETESDPTDNHISTSENPTSNPLMESKGDVGKPPKPLSNNHIATSPLPYMPCVSTTGNGPNGKTINGFLYRYTKTEVRIICVCHGSSFSPEEFVQHAGGTDVSHPLRHITVIPSSF